MTDDIIENFLFAKIRISQNQAELYDKMTLFLQDYCKKVNLTAIRDRKGIIQKHLIDSVLPLTLFDVKDSSRVLDIGTGAGFPAVPMMIYRTDLKFTLLDSQRKRTDYLSLLSKQLGLNPLIVQARAEEIGNRPPFKSSFDIVTARAVSDIPTLLKYSAPFLKSGGTFLAMRGSKDEEMSAVQSAMKKHQFDLQQNIFYHLPDGDGRRLLVFVKA